MFLIIAQLWSAQTDLLLSALVGYSNKRVSAEQLATVKPTAELVILCLKAIQDLLVYGLQGVDANITNVVNLMLSRLTTFADARKHFPSILSTVPY